LFRHLLLQIGGANIAKPPTLSSLADEKRVDSLLRSTAARDPVRATTTADSKRDARAAKFTFQVRPST
jgi:hypothetical protein